MWEFLNYVDTFKFLNNIQAKANMYFQQLHRTWKLSPTLVAVNTNTPNSTCGLPTAIFHHPLTAFPASSTHVIIVHFRAIACTIRCRFFIQKHVPCTCTEYEWIILWLDIFFSKKFYLDKSLCSWKNIIW